MRTGRRCATGLIEVSLEAMTPEERKKTEDAKENKPVWNIKDNPIGLEVIKTARDIGTINESVKKGYLPLIKKIVPSPEIGYYVNVYQNRHTGEIIEKDDDAWTGDLNMEDFEKVIESTYFYPYPTNSPYAAYLIPQNLFIGQKVFLEDLIEDFVGKKIQGRYGKRTERALFAEAIWDGKDLEIIKKTIGVWIILQD